MGTATIRIPEEKRDMKEIITDLIDEHESRGSKRGDKKNKIIYIFAVLPRGNTYS